MTTKGTSLAYPDYYDGDHQFIQNYLYIENTAYLKASSSGHVTDAVRIVLLFRKVQTKEQLVGAPCGSTDHISSDASQDGRYIWNCVLPEGI